MKSRFLARAGLVAAFYVVLTVAFTRLSFGLPVPVLGVIEFRPSEALTVLPILYPEAVPGLYLGCLLANLAGGLGPWDVFGGSAVTLLAALLTRYFRRSFLAYLSPIVLNAFLISLYLNKIFKLPYWVTVVGIGASEAVVVLGLGIPLIVALRRRLGKDAGQQ